LVFVLDYVLPNFFSTRSPEDVSAQVGEALITLAIGFGVAAPLFLLGISYASAVTVGIVSDQVLGTVPDQAAAHRKARSAMRGLFGLTLYQLLVGWAGVLAGVLLLMLSGLMPESPGDSGVLSVLTVVLAIMALIAGAMVLPFALVRHAIAVPAAVIERLGPMDSVKRSVALMKGTGWHPSGYGAAWMLLTVVGLLLLLLTAGVATSLAILEGADRIRVLGELPVLGALAQKALELLPWFLTIWSLVPLWCTTTTVLYYDRRVRLEGYDIATLAQDAWRLDGTSRFEL
jgi:hypothetical protein